MNEGSECRCVIHEPPDTTSWTEGDRELVEDVRRVGWAVNMVKDPDEEPWWAFTIGLRHSFQAPEAVMAGLEGSDMGWWLNRVGERVRDGELELREGQNLVGVIDGFELAVRDVDPAWHRPLFGYAMWFAQRPPLPMVQLIWPDSSGRFPWDALAGERCRMLQPRLWLPPLEHPESVWRSWATS